MAERKIITKVAAMYASPNAVSYVLRRMETCSSAAVKQRGQVTSQNFKWICIS